MGQRIFGIVVKGEIEVPKEIVHFHRFGDTMIILDLDYWEIERFAKICEYQLLERVCFEDQEVIQLSKILIGHTFVVFYYSEWAETIDQQYSVIFKGGKYQAGCELVYQSCNSIGADYKGFINEMRYFSYYKAKADYLATKLN